MENRLALRERDPNLIIPVNNTAVKKLTVAKPLGLMAEHETDREGVRPKVNRSQYRKSLAAVVHCDDSDDSDVEGSTKVS